VRSEEEEEEEPDRDSNKRGGLGTSKQPSLQSKICWKIRQLKSDMKRQSQLFELEEAEDELALFALKMRDFSGLNAIIGSSSDGSANAIIGSSSDGSANAPIEADEVNKVAARLGRILTFRILTCKRLMAKNRIAELEIETLKSSPPRTEQEFKKFKESLITIE
jgi:hypothetical protein